MQKIKKCKQCGSDATLIYRPFAQSYVCCKNCGIKIWANEPLEAIQLWNESNLNPQEESNNESF